MSVQQHGSAFLAPEGPTQILRPSHQTAASQLPAPHTKPAKQHLQYNAVTAASPLPLPRTQVLGQLHANEATVVGPLEHAPGASVIRRGGGRTVGWQAGSGRQGSSMPRTAASRQCYVQQASATTIQPLCLQPTAGMQTPASSTQPSLTCKRCRLRPGARAPGAPAGTWTAEPRSACWSAGWRLRGRQ